MPDINVALTTVKQTGGDSGGLLGNLPPLKGGRHHGPISDPIFLNNNNKKPLQPQHGLTNLHQLNAENGYGNENSNNNNNVFVGEDEADDERKQH